jgi:hypothetical protein
MDKLLKLGFTNLWLEVGLLNEQQVDKLLDEFDKSDDKNTEHYRYGTFRKYLTTKKVLTDCELDNYLKVANLDEDEIMATSAILDILTEIELTDLQFDKVCSEIEELGLGASSLKIVSRQKLLRRLKSENLTDELFAESLLIRDSVTQLYLLDLADNNQLRQLAENGATKVIKKMATEKLNRTK